MTKLIPILLILLSLSAITWLLLYHWNDAITVGIAFKFLTPSLLFSIGVKRLQDED